MKTSIRWENWFPTKESIQSKPRNLIIIIDDQYDEVLKSDFMSQIFKVIYGKKDLSIIVVT